MDNAEIADLLDELADLEGVLGENPFKVRAYRRAADTLRELDEPATTLRERGGLAALPGFGEAIVGKVEQAIETGTFDALERARAAVGMDVRTIGKLPGVGPKTLLALRDELGVRTLEDLEAAAARGRLAKVKGIGSKGEQRIKAALPLLRAQRASMRIDEARTLGARIEGVLDGALLVGAARRCEPTVPGLDLAVADPDACSSALAMLGLRVTERGDPLVAMRGNVPVRLHRADPARDGRRIVELTGPDAHVTALRARAAARGSTWEALAGGEDAVYEGLDLPLIPPETRGDGRELALAEAGGLDGLVTRASLRGDLQCHTTFSDGATPPTEMARAARELGYAYLGVTDHAGALPIANALDADRIDAYVSAVHEAGDATGIRALAGAEVEVDRTGGLTVPDTALERLDYVAIGIHQGLDLAPEQQTARYLQALSHPLVSILLHPTGRKVNERPGARLAWDRVVEVAVEQRVALECNASPVRMDLDGPLARRVLDAGGLLVVSTDAHAPAELSRIENGVMSARKALAPAERVINTWEPGRLEAFLRR